jgi:hypothetical protein
LARPSQPPRGRVSLRLNIQALLAFGQTLEVTLGARRFVVLCARCAAAGGLTSSLVRGGGDTEGLPLPVVENRPTAGTRPGALRTRTSTRLSWGLVAWDGVEPPTRGFSAQAEGHAKKDDDA